MKPLFASCSLAHLVVRRVFNRNVEKRFNNGDRSHKSLTLAWARTLCTDTCAKWGGSFSYGIVCESAGRIFQNGNLGFEHERSQCR